MLDAYVAGVEASRRFRKVLVGKFGDREELKWGIDDELRRAAGGGWLPVYSLGRKSGSMSPSAGFTRGLEFRRVDGRWAVSSMLSLPDDRAELLEMITVTTKTLTDVADDVEAGRLNEFEDVWKVMGDRLKEVLR